MYSFSGVSDLPKAVKIYSSGKCHWVCLQYERRADNSFMHGPPFLYYFGWCPFCVHPYERIEQQFWGWRV